MVVDNESSDGTRALVASASPGARVVDCPNRGFPHANNRAADDPASRATCCSSTPTPRSCEGNFGALVEMLDRRPDVGLPASGSSPATASSTRRSAASPTRRAPSARRSAGALAAAAARGSASASSTWRVYERERECDWTVGAVHARAPRGAAERRAAWTSASSSSPTSPTCACASSAAGWRIVHPPAMTIVHHAGKAGVKPRLVAQDVSPAGSTPTSTSPRRTASSTWAPSSRATGCAPPCRDQRARRSAASRAATGARGPHRAALRHPAGHGGEPWAGSARPRSVSMAGPATPWRGRLRSGGAEGVAPSPRPGRSSAVRGGEVLVGVVGRVEPGLGTPHAGLAAWWTMVMAGRCHAPARRA